MRHEKVPDNRMCPMCACEVLPGDSVIFSHGQILHIKCPVTNEGIAVALGSRYKYLFLPQHPGARGVRRGGRGEHR